VKRLAPFTASLCTLAISTLLTTSVVANKWECGERSNLPQEGKNYCAAGDFRQSETSLEKVLTAVLEKHSIEYGNANELSNAQSAFEVYRDKQCAAENRRIEHEPYHPMIVAQCKTRITNLRIDELKRMLQQKR